MCDDVSSREWLDPETKACLQQAPPLKLAAATTEAFSLVVLVWHPSCDRRRRVRAFQRALGTSRSDAESRASRALPFVAQRSLTLSDAFLAQFELICCDVVSVFIADDAPSLPHTMLTTLKKARIMIHWAKKIGAAISILPRQ